MWACRRGSSEPSGEAPVPQPSPPRAQRRHPGVGAMPTIPAGSSNRGELGGRATAEPEATDLILSKTRRGGRRGRRGARDGGGWPSRARSSRETLRPCRPTRPSRPGVRSPRFAVGTGVYALRRATTLWKPRFSPADDVSQASSASPIARFQRSHRSRPPGRWSAASTSTRRVTDQCRPHHAGV